MPVPQIVRRAAVSQEPGVRVIVLPLTEQFNDMDLPRRVVPFNGPKPLGVPVRGYQLDCCRVPRLECRAVWMAQERIVLTLRVKRVETVYMVPLQGS